MRKKDMMKKIKKLEHIIELQDNFIEYQHKTICDLAFNSHNTGNVITDLDMLDFPNGHK